MMKKSTCLAGALALGLILPAVGLGTAFSTVSAARAQTVGSGPTGSGQEGSGQMGGSVAFVRDAGNGGRFEVQSGRLALERSQHAGVRAYAGQTVKDADEMLDRVTFINNADAGAAMPDGVSADQQIMLNRLARLSGLDFDRLYMQSQIEVGGNLKQTFSEYGANGDSSTMRVYATKAVTDCDARLLHAHSITGAL